MLKFNELVQSTPSNSILKLKLGEIGGLSYKNKAHQLKTKVALKHSYEDEEKGGRQYFTLGMGLRYNVFGLDVSYLIPASAIVRSPLENTLRFSLIFNFNNSEG